jgi:hypothetical protein
MGEDEPVATEATPERIAGVVSDPEELKEFVSPIEPDEYWWFERESEKLIVKIGGDEEYNELIAPWMPDECKQDSNDEGDNAEGDSDDQ